MEITWYFTLEECNQSGFDWREALRGIAQAFSSEPHLLSVTPEDLQTSFSKGLSIIGATLDGRAVAHTRLIPLNEGSDVWHELGSTWVCLSLRGHGVNHVMYKIFLPRHTDKNILATTTNTASLRVGKDVGLIQIERRKLPQDVWKSSCVCSSEKTGSETPANCHLAWGEGNNGKATCWFRVTAETALRCKLTQR